MQVSDWGFRGKISSGSFKETEFECVEENNVTDFWALLGDQVSDACIIIPRYFDVQWRLKKYESRKNIDRHLDGTNQADDSMEGWPRMCKIINHICKSQHFGFVKSPMQWTKTIWLSFSRKIFYKQKPVD